MNFLSELLNFFENNLGIIIFGSVTLVQIAPIKVNPWTFIGNCINGDLKKELSDNQVFVASIFKEEDLHIHFDKVIEFKNKAIENR